MARTPSEHPPGRQAGQDAVCTAAESFFFVFFFCVSLHETNSNFFSFFFLGAKGSSERGTPAEKGGVNDEETAGSHRSLSGVILLDFSCRSAVGTICISLVLKKNKESNR